jgi:hypothetical protein
MSELTPPSNAIDPTWVEFWSVETEDAFTFDPLRYALAAKGEEADAPSVDWEATYAEHPSYLALDLLGNVPLEEGDYAKQLCMVLAAKRIVDSLPEQMQPGQAYWEALNIMKSHILQAYYTIDAIEEYDATFNEYYESLRPGQRNKFSRMREEYDALKEAQKQRKPPEN